MKYLLFIAFLTISLQHLKAKGIEPLISQASFVKGSLRYKAFIERPLLKKPIEFVKKTGVSAVLACSLAFTGCGAPIVGGIVASTL